MGKLLTKEECEPQLVGRTTENDLEFGDVVIFGAEKVGKTALVHRFVHNYFTDNHEPTNGMHSYDVIALIETDDAGDQKSLIFRNSFKKSVMGREKMASVKKDLPTETPNNLSPEDGDSDNIPIHQYRRVSAVYAKAEEMGQCHLKFKLVDTASDFAEMEPTSYRAAITNAEGFILVCSFDNEDSLEYIEDRFRDIQRVKKISETVILIVANKSDLPDNEKVLSEDQITDVVSQLRQTWSSVSAAEQEGYLNLMQDMFSKIHLSASRKDFLKRQTEDDAFHSYDE